MGFKVVSKNLFSISLISLVFINSTSRDICDCSQICVTQQCKLAAKALQRTIDLSRDPCIDFYEFTCGLRGRSVSSDAEELVFMNQNKLLHSPENDHNSTSSYWNHLSNFHQSCVHRERQNDNYIIELLFGGDLSIEGSKDWAAIGAKIQNLGFSNPFFSLSTNYFGYDTNKLHLELGPRSFTDGSNFKRLVAALTHLKDPEAFNRTNLDWAQVLAAKLQEIAKSSRKGSDQVVELMNLKKLQDMTPNTNWWELITGLLGRPLPEKEVVIVRNVDYALKLDKLIGETKRETIEVFMLLQMLDEGATFSGKALSRVASMQQLGACQKHVMEQLGFLYSYEYSRRYVSEERRRLALRMFNQLQSNLETKVSAIQWTTDETKRIAVNKLKQIRVSISEPELFLTNETFFKHLFGANERLFKEDTYLENILTIRRAELKVDMELLLTGSSYKELAWLPFKQSYQMQAKYDDSFNSISIFAGYLNDYFINENQPNYINYALVGSTIGHEIVHSLDRNGILMDDKADRRRWWDVDSQVGYERRLDSLRDAYRDLRIPQTRTSVDANKTLDENLADVIGFNLAYEVYSDYLESRAEEHEEDQLKGFERFNERQSFWVWLGASWCSSLSPAEEARRAESDTHSPNRFRVNIPLQNVQSFARDFNCPLGSSMNPSPQKLDLF